MLTILCKACLKIANFPEDHEHNNGEKQTEKMSEHNFTALFFVQMFTALCQHAYL